MVNSNASQRVPYMNKDVLNPQGDGSSKPRPNTPSNPNSDPGASAKGQTPVAAAPLDPPKPPVSEPRLRANRENAKKSTGPQTARGKAYSRRNALKHGLLAKSVLFRPD